MTYYEELGVPEDASTEEIRKAFRTLSRMLHPDLQPEGSTRRLAQAQMQRLNHVVDTLCDEDKRAEYDASLGSMVEAGPVAKREEWLWPALLCVLALVGVWLWRMPPRGAEAAMAAGDEGAVILSSPGNSVRKAPQLEPNLGEVVTPPAAIRPKLSVAKGFREPEKATLPDPPELQMQALAKIEPYLEPQIPLLPNHMASSVHRLDGIWLYAMDPRSKPAVWSYAAEYVELKVQEHNGELVGSYRSRYKVPDRLVRPEVSFRFRGSARENEFEWREGVLRGKIHLVLQGEDVLEASWRVVENGSMAGLAAGSATLMRRQD